MSEWPFCHNAKLKALSPSQLLRFLISSWRRGFKSYFWRRFFYNWKRFWDRKHYSFHYLFCHLTQGPMIELSLISLCQQVRMAERSKAPDSRCYLFLSRWGFWSPHGGVGSNPTSDTSSFWIGSIFETVNIIVSIVYFAIWPIQIFNILVLEYQNGRVV